ncbi:MAG: hypothetical protein AAFX94_16565 [Myxococcota bacterium]
MSLLDEPNRSMAWLTPALLALSLGLNALFMVQAGSKSEEEPAAEWAMDDCACVEEPTVDASVPL